MAFCDKDMVRKTFEGRSVAIVGSGPGVLANRPGYIDRHDVVVRVNNYKLLPATGYRTDVFYSFFGSSIRKTREELIRDGVKLCICKCPDAKVMDSAWHEDRGKTRGTDFRYIYEDRSDWWFCDTYVPTVGEFNAQFALLGGRVPTTGFSAILDVLDCKPSGVYLTGFDFFTSGIHNVNERWRKMNRDDPIGHAPDRELSWLFKNMGLHAITCDERLRLLLHRSARMLA